MSTDHLISDEVLSVADKTLVMKPGIVPAAIDRGSTLTKILYITKSSDDASCQLHCALFRNKHFTDALQFLKAKLSQCESAAAAAAADAAGGGAAKLRMTGVGTNLYGDKVKEILGVDTEFIDEAVCQFAGFYFLLKHFELRDICHPAPTFDETLLNSIQRGETFQRIRNAQIAMMKSSAAGEKFPCLFAIYGSSAGIVLVKEDGTIEVKHRHLLAGKTFLGMCKMLIGTSDYQQIMDMAASGKRGNIDTQVREILTDAPNSPYGRMPPTLPFFPFGKAVDFDKSLEDTKPEDVAQSLVSSFTVNFINVVSFVASHERVPNVFLGGNFFQHEFPRIEVMKNTKLFGTSEIMKVHFLKTGHTGALGALLNSKQDVTDFFAQMKLKSS